VPLNEIKQMVHEAFYHFIRRPSFLLEQMARTLKSSYRMKVVMNNLSRIGDVRENIRNVT